MLTKYEELKIASTILGEAMTKLLNANPHEIREACINSGADPDLSNRINEVIAQANEKWDGFYYSKKKLTDSIA